MSLFLPSDLEAKGFRQNAKGEWEKSPSVSHDPKETSYPKFLKSGPVVNAIGTEIIGWVNAPEPSIQHHLIAIDPGASGGVAIGGLDGTVEAFSLKDRGDLAKLIKERHLIGLNAKAYVELVTGYIAKKKVPSAEEEFSLDASGYRMFNFGKSAGYVEGVLDGLGIPWEHVSPKTWQKPLYLERNGLNRSGWKNLLKEKMQKLYPQLKVTLNTADALGILHFATLKQQ